jgi:hypothetical protein
VLGVAAEVDDRRAEVERRQLGGQSEHVGERQVQVCDLAGHHELELLDHLADRDRVAVCEDDALRRPRRSRRVDDRVRITRLDLALPSVQNRDLAASPALPKLLERQLAHAGFDPDHVDEVRQRAANLLDLRELLCVLADHRPSPGVASDPLALRG